MADQLKITQVKSEVGSPKKQRATLEALGLRYQRSVIQKDSPSIRGMIFQVRHMVEVEEVE